MQVFFYDYCEHFIKKRLQHKCFPVIIGKFLRAPILKNICERLLLAVLTTLNNSYGFLYPFCQNIVLLRIVILIAHQLFGWRGQRGFVGSVGQSLVWVAWVHKILAWMSWLTQVEILTWVAWVHKILVWMARVKKMDNVKKMTWV